MPDLYAVRGRITALQHHVNVHLWRHRPFTPSERYELWLRRPDGSEQLYTLPTRVLPARRGHEVSLIVATGRHPRVLGLANWSTLDGVNYLRCDAPALLRPSDGLICLLGLLAAALGWGEPGLLLAVPAGLLGLVVLAALRGHARLRRAARVDRAIDHEAGRQARNTHGPAPTRH